MDDITKNIFAITAGIALIFIFAGIFYLAMYAAIIYISLHFIGKF